MSHKNSLYLSAEKDRNMGKTLFKAEFDINASNKMLYPYISTASGLAQWFADDVTLDENKNFNFIWESEDHKAKMVSHRINNFVKFEFLKEEKEVAYFEIRLQKNELTETVYMVITDYSDMDDEKELYQLWRGLIDNLKEIVGG